MLADRIVLVGADLVLPSLLQARHTEVVAWRGQQHPAGVGNRPHPLEQRLALRGEGGGEQAIVGLVQGQAVQPVPGETQTQAVIDLGTLEHGPDDLGADPVDAVVTGEVLVVDRHIERREVLGQQHHLVAIGQLGMGRAGTEQKAEQQTAFYDFQH
ncbi:hypothetical protein D3C84_830030 [compost metagenome]